MIGPDGSAGAVFSSRRDQCAGKVTLRGDRLADGFEAGARCDGKPFFLPSVVTEKRDSTALAVRRAM